MNFFIGNFEDQIYLGTFSWWVKYALVHKLDIFFNPYLGLFGTYYEILNSSQPLLWYPVALLYALLPQTFAYTLAILLILTFNVASAFFYFNKIKKNYFVSFVFGVFFGLSPYVILHTGRHLDLMNVGFFPILFYVINAYFIKSDSTVDFKKGLVRMFFIIYLQSLISNYYGMFMILISLCMVLVFTIQKFVFHKELYLNKVRILGFAAFYSALLLSLVLSLFSYFQTLLTPIKDPSISPAFTRTIEDFADFSSRPWTFLIPPTNHLIYGGLSTYTLNYLKELSDNYFWFSNYFVFEHGGNYLGLIIIILAASALMFKNWFLPKQKGFIVAFSGLALLLFFLSLPPFLTINGTYIYLPSYFIYKYFGVFRSLNRLSVPISLSILSCAYLFVSTYFERNKSILRYILVFIICIFMFLDILVPLKIQNISNVPEVYTYLQTTPEDSKVVFYPSDRRDIFWLNIYKRVMVNPRSYVAGQFSADLLTSQIIKNNGIYKLKEIGANYLVINRFRISDFEYNIFKDASLYLEKETPDTYIFKIIYEKSFKAEKIPQN